MKKVFGFILLSIGGYMLISLIMEFFGALDEVTEAAKLRAENPEQFEVGVVLGRIMLVLIALLAIFMGYKLLKSANEETNTAVEKPKESATQSPKDE